MNLKELGEIRRIAKLEAIEELRMALAGIKVVSIDTTGPHDLIRRESVLDLVDQRRINLKP